MTSNRSQIEKWTAEYRQRGIPSSVRETPSGAVTWAVRELKQGGFALRTALDLGCGKGRNSLFLAEQRVHVTAFDFTADVIEHLQTTATEHRLTSLIRALAQDVTDEWPVTPGIMDLAVDAFCFKHIAPKEARMAYKSNLLRALKPHGHYMISCAGIDDGYYGQFVTDKDNRDEQIVVDPVLGVESVLYSREALLRFFAPQLVPWAELQNNKPSVMHGKEYKRSTLAFLMRRNPQAI